MNFISWKRRGGKGPHLDIRTGRPNEPDSNLPDWSTPDPHRVAPVCNKKNETN